MKGAGARELILVDTSAWIAFFAKSGHHNVKSHLGAWLDADRVAVAGPILLELVQGCRSAAEREQLTERLHSLHWLKTEDHHWLTAGKTAFDLRRIGITVSAVDALIATLAESYDCGLLHQDSDFDRIARHRPLHVISLANFKNPS